MASAALLLAVEGMGRAGAHHLRTAAAARRAFRVVLLGVCGLLLGLGWERPAQSQPCLTCRTERCPTKPNLKAWCGAPCKDPLAPCPTHEPPAQPRVQVLSEPAGATVRLGSAKGSILGVTPLKDVELARGRHQLWLSLPGYEDRTLEVQVQARGPKQFSATLRPLAERVQPAVAPAVPLTPMAALAPAAPDAAGASAPLAQPVAASAPPTPPSRVPLYKKWWLWTVVGVVTGAAVAGIAGGIVASRSGPPESPLGTVPVSTATGAR